MACRHAIPATKWGSAPSKRSLKKVRGSRDRARKGICRHGCCEGVECDVHDRSSGNGFQRGWRSCTKLTGISDLANALDDNVMALGTSALLLVVSAILPSTYASAASNLVSRLAVALAFALVAVPAGVELVDDVLGMDINIHVLMTLGAFASLLLGNAWEGALLLVLFSGSHVAEHKLTDRASKDASELQKLSPEVALVVTGGFRVAEGKEKVVRVQDVEIGEVVLVRTGELVPLDGIVVGGECLATMEHLTGEAAPFHLKENDAVPAGSIALDGRLLVRVTARKDASTLERIGSMTMESIRSKPKLKTWLEDFGSVYSKLVLITSVALMFLGPILMGWRYLPHQGVPGSVHRALGLMVAAAPCSLSVTPLAYIAAVSSLARKGIILRSSRILDALLACDVLAFDKTGTLTTGELELDKMTLRTADGFISDNVKSGESIAIAGAVEQYAVHPIAQALVRHARDAKGLPSVEVNAFSSEPGQGLAAEVMINGRQLQVKIGRPEYILRSLGPDESSAVEQEVAKMRQKATAIAMMSVGDSITIFSFQDRLRPHMGPVVKTLKKYFGKIVMLTGDQRVNALAVAKEVGIQEVHSDLRPEEKLKYVQEAVGLGEHKSSSSRGLVMVGEGMNDAPSLAAATVGVVLAERASAASMVAGDVILLGDAVETLPLLLSKARQTRRVVSQGVFLALFFIFAASIPAVMGTIPLWLTVVLHEGGTLAVCMNALRTLESTGPRTSQLLKGRNKLPQASPVLL